MRRRLVSRAVGGHADVRAFFDEAAADYRDVHDRAQRCFRERLRLLRTLLPEPRGGTIVEIGCGTAMHLLGLADGYDRAIGLDLSPAMIARCETLRPDHPLRPRLHFAVDPAEELRTLADGSVDALFCVGAFEHVLDKQRAAAQVHRVLKPGAAFACLSPNGGYVWYARIAPALGIETRHLSTDRFLTETEWRRLLAVTGFCPPSVGHWTFIPRGDMPPASFWALTALDRLGRLLGAGSLRGGVTLRAVKPPD